MIASNEEMEKEIDEILFSQKEAGEELSEMGAELQRPRASVESKFLNGGDPDKVREYRALVNDFESLVAETNKEEMVDIDAAENQDAGFGQEWPGLALTFPGAKEAC